MPAQADQAPAREDESIAALLLREMEARNWSQRDMAKACQVSNTTISKIVREQSVPDPNTCYRLAQGLELPAPYVLRMAGHEIAQVQAESPSLEAVLHAQYARLPDRAIQEMLGAIRAIESAYTTPLSRDRQLAQERLERLELMRRWLDPIKRRTLTLVQGGQFTFYQLADLDESGREVNRGELFQVEEGVARLSIFPMHFVNSFCVQLYPLCEFEPHRCRSHPQHTVLFTPLYAGDRGTGVTLVYPDGRRAQVHDQLTAQLWQRIYANLDTRPPGQAAAGDDFDTGRLGANPDELWINPDARTYAAMWTIPQEPIYALLSGPLSELADGGWRAQRAERVEIVDAALYGRFKTSIVHLQGFCLQLYPTVEHATAARHMIPAHRVLIWEQEGQTQVCVLHDALETWLRLEVAQDRDGQVSVTILEDERLLADSGRQRYEEQKRALEAAGISLAEPDPSD